MTDFEVLYETVTLIVPTQGSVPVISISDWIIWMHRVVASGFNWNLTWNEYKDGFGSSDSEDFWLGWRDCNWDRGRQVAMERLQLGRRASGWVWRGFTF